MLADGKGMLFNTENTTEEKMILRKDRVHDFIKNSQKYGFVYDEDGAYICKKCLSDSDAELYIQFTICTSSLNIYVELHVPKAYWIEFGLCTFEPLCSLYREGYIEITNQRN